MTANDFVQYFNDPDLLAALPLEELLEQVRRHPYQSNLQLLLALKAKREGHPEYEYFLQRLAATTFDRAQLYNLLHQQQQQASVGEQPGETLELRTLEELELVPLSTTPFEELPSRLNQAPAPRVPSVASRGTSAPAPLPEAARPPRTSPRRTLGSVSQDWVATAATYVTLLSLADAAPPAPPVPDGPQPPAAFAGVLQRYRREETLSDRLALIRKQRHLRPQAVGRHAASEAVVSETLARLLASQGQNARAIRMYRQLALLYPEKKSIFADLIQQLKE